MRYLPRVVDRELDDLLAALPAIAVEGAKGVGKTETASRRVHRMVALDDPAQLAPVAADMAWLESLRNRPHRRMAAASAGVGLRPLSRGRRN